MPDWYVYKAGYCSEEICPDSISIGPVLASAALIPDVSKLQIRGLKNGNVMQEYCPLTYVIFASHYLWYTK